MSKYEMGPFDESIEARELAYQTGPAARAVQAR